MEEYFVAYIDFLGIKNKINKNPEKTFEDLDKIYDEIAQNIAQNNKLVFPDSKLYSDIKISIFSDNIAIFTPNNGSSSSFTMFLKRVAIFQATALKNGYLTRGAVSKSKLNFNSWVENENKIIADIISGPALVKAVDMENTSAIYPRIILDFDIKEETYFPYLENDIDNFRYIKYFDTLYEIFKRESEDDEQIPNKINTLLNDLYKNEVINNREINFKVKQKYNWLISKYNQYCIEQNREKYKITLE